MKTHVRGLGWGFSLFGAKPASSAGAEAQGNVLPLLSSPGLGFRAGDGEYQLLVELVAGGGTTSTPAAPTQDPLGCSMSMARAPAAPAPRRISTRDQAEHRIFIPQLVQDNLVPVTVSAGDGEDDVGVGQVVDSQLTSGNGFSSTSPFHSEGTANEDQVNAADVPPATPAGTPPQQLIRTLGTMSVMTLSCVVSTALYQPAAGVLFGRSKVGYYVTLAAIFAAGVAEAITAVLLSRSCRRVIFGRVVLCAGVVPLVAVLGIGGSRFIIKA